MNPEPIAPAAPATGQLPAYLPPTAPPRRRHTGLVVGLILAALVLVGGGVALALALTHAGPIAGPSTFTANGTLTMKTGCESIGGYGDITTGTQVVLTGDGKTLSVGTLASTHSSTQCAYTFTLEKVPAGLKFYGVTISHRGTVQFTEADLRAGINLTL